MIWIIALGTALYNFYQTKASEKELEKLNLSGNKNTAANDLTTLLYNTKVSQDRNTKAGNWGWGRGPQQAPTTLAFFRQPTPILSDAVEWGHEGSQWFRTPEYRELYTKNYRNAWSAESAHAVRTQLVSGFWKESITKGRTLITTTKSDGRYNPDGANLYKYST